MIIPSQYQELESVSEQIAQQNARCLVFISPNEGTGNTSLALSVAKRLGEQNERVLFIDVNSSNPSVDSFKEHLPESLPEWSFSDISVQLNNHKLFGFYFLSISALTDIERVRDKDVFSMALAMLKQEFDYIIFDTSPLLRRNSGNFPTQLLLSESDLVFVSVAINKTTKEQLDLTVCELNKARCKRVEFIANHIFMRPLGERIIDSLSKHLNHFPKVKSKLIHVIKGSSWLTQGV